MTRFGKLIPQQRDQLVSDVARVTGISPDDARRRVDEAQNTIKATLEQARQKVREAAEATRQAISTASYSAFAAMIVGLVFALLGAYYGELDEENLPRFARIRLKRMAPK
jgi:VIT1/CCC1 family predicted Fe2+/Mn2+ transporter